MRPAGASPGERCSQHLLAWLACWLIVTMIGGCTSAPVPVSERDVTDYRKAGPNPPPVPPRSTVQAAGPAEPKPSTPATTVRAPATPSKSSALAAGASAAEGAEEGDWRPESYTVKRGDTLYGVALDHGLDYKELAAWNQLADANVIKVGQQLRLRAPPGWKAEPADADEVIARPLAPTAAMEPQLLELPPAPKAQPKGIKLPYSDDALAQLMRDSTSAPSPDAKSPTAEPKVVPPEQELAPRPPQPKAAPEAKASAAAAAAPVKADAVAAKPGQTFDDKVTDQPLQWVWPANGKLVHAFNQGSNPKGLAIRGAPGQPVFATAAGKVVYSGSGLRGYGKLVIIKHNSTYLSVYAHNRELLVKEGERVSRGQKIAEMGGNSADGIALHFEIRRLGKPVDPLKFLPQEGA
jgi:lipoprotein NlpD